MERGTDANTRLMIDADNRREGDAFRLLVESTVDYAIFMLNPEGLVSSWNAGAKRIKGYEADEIIGKHFSTFYTPEAVAAGWPEHELRESERVGRFEDEGWRVRKDGSLFWANVVITPIRGHDGTLRGFAKVTRDMTERKANEERIERLRLELEARVRELGAANRELSQKSAENESFVYSVSHDLRSPLVNLQGFSQELLLTSGELAETPVDPAVPAAIQQKAIGSRPRRPRRVGHVHPQCRAPPRKHRRRPAPAVAGRPHRSTTFEPVNLDVLVADILVRDALDHHARPAPPSTSGRCPR